MKRLSIDSTARMHRDWTNDKGQRLINDVPVSTIRKGDVLLGDDYEVLGTVTKVVQFQGRMDVTLVGHETTVQFDRDHEYVVVLRGQQGRKA